MRFSIGAQFSREFNFEETLLITNTLNNNFSNFFTQKKYSLDVNKIYINIICVSKEFEPFFKVRPLKILKKEAAVEY
ncbi:hypothetical protein [Flavobacterium inviolabile]|uniref:hypothetical protein n=1 Tax=Flavobacterium inviolabile TaxID=2748320 RepID=UPI0015B1C9F9|nr:hypothetical protein [Flavobacterium inviolabile]